MDQVEVQAAATPIPSVFPARLEVVMDTPPVVGEGPAPPLAEPTRWFSELTLDHVPLVGGKNASLGEMTSTLGPLGVQVPAGFAIVASVYRSFLRDNQLEPRIRDALDGVRLEDVPDLRRRGLVVRQLILGATLPRSLTVVVLRAYERLSDGLPEGIDVAVRSSATTEDLRDTSFAGQHDTFLNVRGAGPLLDAIRRCYASLYNDRAISYRAERGLGQLDAAMAIGIQKMVRADHGCAGVMFTLDPETGFRDVVVVSASYGLGENVVQGTVVPDEFTVFKPTLRTGSRPVVRRLRGTKELRLVYDEGGGRGTRNVPVPKDERRHYAIDDNDVLELAREACVIEDHYSTRYGRPTPMDIEWAKDGRTGQLFVVQARPETVHGPAPARITRYILGESGPAVVSGRAVGDRIASGRVRIVRTSEDLSSFRDHEILVAERVEPEWEPVMRRAAAVVTEFGGRSCHAAIISRELGIPAVVGAASAMTLLRPGATYTVSCAQGEAGWVLENALPFDVEEVDPSTLDHPRTRIGLDLDEPSEAFRLAALPNDGIGLLREETTLTRSIGIHPMALMAPERLPPELRAEIERRISPCPDPRWFFVDRLSEAVGTIAAAFWPKDVFVRLSDLDSDDYARLLGGERFEPNERNPVLGFRGAARYTDSRCREAFGLECEALVRVRESMGLVNTHVVIPFVRTVSEARRVQAEMARHGLERGLHGLQVQLMCQVPSNVIGVDTFAELFDGFVIDWTGLGHLLLGVDLGCEILGGLYDEPDPAVVWAIERVVAGAHRAGRTVGICGQPPSDHAAFAQLLVRLGVDSLSVDPRSVVAWTQRLSAAESPITRDVAGSSSGPAG